MREGRPISGRMPRSIFGRGLGLQPKYQPPAGHGPINQDSGTPGIGVDDEELLMLYENGSPMQFEDGTNMQYERPV